MFGVYTFRQRAAAKRVCPQCKEISIQKLGRGCYLCELRSMPPFKDEHVLIIAPGSETTLAQLGIPESLTPAKWRFPTRMFPGEKEGEWEPNKIRVKTVEANVDAEMQDATTSESLPNGDATATKTETIYEDDPLSLTDAVYPIVAGQVVNWPCLGALLTHINNMLSPPFHTPCIVIAQPAWTTKDHEMLTQFFFENFKIPALCLMDASAAAVYAMGVETACVVDVGLDKCDVSAVTGFCVNEFGRGVSVKGCGGRDMTRRLKTLLEGQGFDEEMCEQLKKSAICEVLPAGAALPSAVAAQTGADTTNPAAAASTGAMDSGADAKNAEGLRLGQEPLGPGMGTMVGQEGDNGDDDENEGILDVAAIVAKDNAAELLAKREKEKAEKAAARKGAADAARVIRLRNSEKVKNTFTYEEILPYEAVANGDGVSISRKRKRDVEVGIERFMATSAPDGSTDGVLDTIAATIHHTIMSVQDVSQRSALWENLIILGNGTRVRGFKEALLSTLQTRYVLSPSTATMFTSELPSNFSTPLPTNGTNTPIPGQTSQSLHHPGINPLLVAATKHANQQMPSSQQLQVPNQEHHIHRGHSQTPTSIKVVKAPEYFPEWKDVGFEEATFLGAQVAGKVVFVVDQGLSKGFLTRGEYNDLGPAGIHECAM